MNAYVVLAPAPEVARGQAVRRRRTVPAALLLAVGIALMVVPLAAGMFGKVAAGQQVLDRFQPHLEASALDQIHHDLIVLEAGRTAAAATIEEAHVAKGRFPGLDIWASTSGAQVNTRATDLLTAVRGAVPDYRSVRAIGGFDRIPFLVVAAGLALTYAGAALLGVDRRSYRSITALGLVAGVVLIAFPFVSGLAGHAGAAQSLLTRLQPIVTNAEVVHLQHDFVVVVTAVGEVDTSFGGVPTNHRGDLSALRKEWPQISSDLASLVGDLNDSVADVAALTSLNNLPVAGKGFTTLPGAFVGTGIAACLLTLTAQPRSSRTRKEQR